LSSPTAKTAGRILLINTSNDIEIYTVNISMWFIVNRELQVIHTGVSSSLKR